MIDALVTIAIVLVPPAVGAWLLTTAADWVQPVDPCRHDDHRCICVSIRKGQWL